MTFFLFEYRNIFIFTLCSFVLAIILLVIYILNFTFNIVFSETSYPFEVQFAVIAIMFLLFDIEVLYLFPLVQSLYSLYSLDLVIILGFYVLLVIGLLYEISRKVLNFQTINQYYKNISYVNQTTNYIIKLNF